MVLLLESIFIYLTEDKRSSIKDVALTPAGVDFTSRGRFHQHFSSSFSANFLSPKNITNCKCRKDVLDTFVSKAAHKMFINLSPAGVNFNSTSTCITFILIFLVLGKLKTAQILIIFYTQNNINKL